MKRLGFHGGYDRKSQLFRTAILIGGLALSSGCRRSNVSGSSISHAERSFDGHSYSVVQVDLRRATIELFRKMPDQNRFDNFDALKSFLDHSHRRLEFAANAGIFEPDWTPTGLHVESGLELVPLNLNDGTGNFYLQPNGVFMVDDGGARIVESTNYPGTTARVRLATQSGPMLVTAGKINPAFADGWKSVRIRSGVGLVDTDHVVFLLSRHRVTFHEFAEMFCSLGCADALYLDGEISRFYLPGERHDAGDEHFAGILAVVGRE